MDENFLTIVDENGGEILCRVLYTFYSEDYDKSYVYYVPLETTDEDEDVEVFCSSYVPQENGAIGQLSPIESDEEWEMVEEMFNTEFPEGEEGLEFEDDDEEESCGCCHHGDDDDDEEEECEEGCGCGHNHGK